MSQLSKSLEKRIQELTASIESQKTELAAYERVLHMELSKEESPAEVAPVAPEIAVALAAHSKAETPAPKATGVSYSGNKTALVADIVKSFGSKGATPKDVDAFFNEKNIKRSKNLVYNTLSYLVTRKSLVRRDGKYFLSGTATAAPAKKKAAAAPVKTKRKLSPEGLKRIKEALKKRWADKRAADAAATKKK
jgi:hypothetical protein